MSDPFPNLSKTEEKSTSVVPVVDDKDISTQITGRLAKDTRDEITPAQAESVRNYVQSMRYGVIGVSPITCRDQECPYFSKCPLVLAEIARPTGKDCPVEAGLQNMWLDEFVKASGSTIDELSAYDMLILNDLAYQQVLESRAAMELADNPKIQVRTFMGKDPKTQEPMYTYTLNNLVTFREKSAKMKMKLLNEMIATARAKSADSKAHIDKSSAAALALRRVEDLLGDQAITRPEPIDAEFEVKNEDGS